MKFNSSKKISFQFIIAICIFILIIGLSQESSQQNEQGDQTTAFNGNTEKVEISPDQLIEELGCNTCHNGLSGENSLRTKAPDLSHGGLRYNPSYLFDYLQNPSKVRHHIGRSRMPDFQFSPEESLALSLFLATEKEVTGDWPEFPNIKSGGGIFGGKVDAEKAKKLLEEFTCLNCHKVDGKGNPSLMISDLSSVSYKLNQDWVKDYLVAPYVFRGRETLMPTLFYGINKDSTRFTQKLQEAPSHIKDITQYLFSLNEEKGKVLTANFEKAKKDNPQINAEKGQRIFQSQNCAACHRSPESGVWIEKNAPNLAMLGEKVNHKWLQKFLEKPHAIRPFGFHPGSGSRMPDFKLNEEEVNLLSSFFIKKTPSNEAFEVKKLSAFAKKKADQLIRDKLSCLGCHQLGQEGGKIGPNLSNLKERLQGNYVYQIVQNPHDVVPETIMPKVLMPEKNLNLIVNYLLQQEDNIVPNSYLSLIDNQLILTENEASSAQLYLKYCAACHGTKGKGDGFNIPYMNAVPTQHADGNYMSLRPDDTLFDGIYAGGYILNKSHLMPPFGETLDKKQISNLVEYMRTLCNCQGPDWSRDNN